MELSSYLLQQMQNKAAAPQLAGVQMGQDPTMPQQPMTPQQKLALALMQMNQNQNPQGATSGLAGASQMANGLMAGRAMQGNVQQVPPQQPPAQPWMGSN